MRSVTFLLLLLVQLVIASRSQNNSDVEKALEDTIRGSLSLQFSMNSRDEDLFVLIINQKGYEVCKGMINQKNIDKIRCTFSQDILTRGDNKFDITVYSPKNKVLVLKSSTNFHYIPKPKGKSLSGAISAVKGSVFRNDVEELDAAKRDPLKKLLIASGIITAGGAFAAYLWPLRVAIRNGLLWQLAVSTWCALFLKSKVVFPPADLTTPPPPSLPPPSDDPDSPFTSETEAHSPSLPPSSPSAPPALLKGASRAPSGLTRALSTVRHSLRKVAATRSARYALFLLAVAMMNQEGLQQAYEQGLSRAVVLTNPAARTSTRTSTRTPPEPVVVHNKPSKDTQRTESFPTTFTSQPESTNKRISSNKLMSEKMSELDRRIDQTYNNNFQRLINEAVVSNDGKRITIVTNRKRVQPTHTSSTKRESADIISHVVVLVTHHIPELTHQLTIRNMARLVQHVRKVLKV